MIFKRRQKDGWNLSAFFGWSVTRKVIWVRTKPTHLYLDSWTYNIVTFSCKVLRVYRKNMPSLVDFDKIPFHEIPSHFLFVLFLNSDPLEFFKSREQGPELLFFQYFSRFFQWLSRVFIILQDARRPTCRKPVLNLQKLKYFYVKVFGRWFNHNWIVIDLT